jgi:cobalamin synthase
MAFCPLNQIPIFGHVLDSARIRRNTMRVFIASCLVAGVIAGAAAVILDKFVQEPVSVAFAEPSADPGEARPRPGL